MWYKNKKTGKTWDITNEKVLKRISKNPDYEPIEEIEDELPFVPDEEEVKEAPKKAGVKRGRTAAKAKK